MQAIDKAIGMQVKKYLKYQVVYIFLVKIWRKDLISVAFDVIFVSFRCVCCWEVIFYRNGSVESASSVHYWQVPAI